MKQRKIKASAVCNLTLIESFDSVNNRSTSYLTLTLNDYEKVLIGNFNDLIYLLSHSNYGSNDNN